MSKEVTLQMVDVNGDTLFENTLTVNDGAVFLMEYDNSVGVSYKDLGHIFKSIKSALESDSKLIAYPSFINLKIINK